MSDTDSDVRIILVGKTGAGKSATGNTILGRDEHFKEDTSPNAVTETCKEGKMRYGKRKISVVDTPGIFGSLNKEIDRKINECVTMAAPGPHAFLLVISLGRYTEEEQKAVTWIQENFGEDASLYTIISFTHCDWLKGKSLDDYIRESRDLQRLIHSCGGRFHGFNNEDRENRTQVTELLRKIDEMVMKNGGDYYTNEMFQKGQNEKEKKKREIIEKMEKEKMKGKLKDAALGLGVGLGVGGIVAGGVALGVTGAVVLPALGVATGIAVAVESGVKLISDTLQKKNK